VKVTGYNGNGRHIIYGRLMWKGVRQMSEDKEGTKGMGRITWSSGEQMVGKEMVEKVK
jgi:hypothetical protein